MEIVKWRWVTIEGKVLCWKIDVAWENFTEIYFKNIFAAKWHIEARLANGQLVIVRGK